MADLAAGDEFAGCRIDAVAGRGGMGVVYRATDLALDRPVALKLLAADRAGDPDFRERFQRESRMAASIDHPNVIPVYGAGEHDGRLYLLMRWVPGTDLQEELRRERALAPERAAEIVAQVGAGLDAAHAAGLVHRDVKPANVLLAGDHAYLSDFGLTRLVGSDTELTEAGRWIGTVDYCSPEQLRGERTDARSDVYALGCVLFAALTGVTPFGRGTVPATMMAHLHDAVPRASAYGAPRAFDGVIARALAKDPARRFPSAGDLGRAALAAARGEPVTESERSVARGPAAPAGAAGNGAEPPTVALAGAAAAPATAATAAAAPGEDATVALGGDAPGGAPGGGGGSARGGASAGGGGDDAPAATRHGDARGGAPGGGPGAPEVPGGASRRRRRVHRGPRRRPLVAAATAIAGLALLGAGLGLVLGGPDGEPTGPLSRNEVRSAAQAFADAYGREDPGALRRALARDVLRVLPSGVARGRDDVVAQYERQFDGRVGAYELTNLEVSGGSAGRASGDYRVQRRGGPAIEGHIVFGVVRDRGRPRIALIAATPRA